ncbi:MAG: hypothetical protein K5987_07820 [Lachnospiraceae bacterium]|nr:hypothetical protein [Lachnospiraceae bacterium]
MYKKQMVAQKVICLLVLASSVIVFLYSLGILTDLYDSFYLSIRNPDKPERNPIAGSTIFYDMQPFDRTFLKLSLVLILTSVFLFIMNTHSRRRYYLGNIVSVIVSVVAHAGVMVWASSQIKAFKDQFLTTVDFEAFKNYADSMGSLYTESTFWFDLHVAVFAFSTICSLLLIANVFWKFSLMKNEAALVEAGREI